MFFDAQRITVNPQVVGSSPTRGANKNTVQSDGIFIGLFAACSAKIWLTDRCCTD